ncbi:MAG: hypothetical protein HYS25_12560 [Ignavibacteriales bacterium]|nr:hypothetical protein [Ignavibacteriales bacterium]
MQKYFKVFLAALLILSSCKLKDGKSDINDPGTGGVTIKVTSPNGGETLMDGETHAIQWSSANITYVRIQFSIDNGATWSLVADSAKSLGNFSWQVPNIISSQCKIRIVSADGQTADESDNVFSIIKNSNESIRIVSPAGGESWEGGTAKEIKWYSSGLDSVKIEYSTNNGNNWHLIAVDKKNTGIYYWEPVPNTPSTLAQIRITNAKDGSPSAVSLVFNILPEPILKVLSPNGGEVLLSGGSRKVEWVSENIQNVKIAYTTDNGFGWTTIVESTPSIGFYTWNQIPNLNSQLCKIRIFDAVDGEPSDVSDSVFTITNQVTQTLEVTLPNGSESWQAGTAKSIIWKSSGVSNVKIDFTSNNGITWNNIIDNLYNTGAYEWNVPNSLSTQCLIRISDANDGEPVDQSNGPFNIVPKPELKIIAPNGGETWTAGQIDTIKWYSVGVENVFIDYTADNGITWNTIVEKTPSDGEYAFSFSSSGTLFKVRIIDAENLSPRDESDGTFTVLPEPKIIVVSPNGGEELYVGSSNNIMWTSNNIENVKIDFTTNNGATWATIVNSTPSDGVFAWNSIPDLSSLQCRIRISDAVDGIPADISDDNFTITTLGNQLIRVTAPNGGEDWQAGSAQNITWDAAGITNVKIEFTTNNGINWSTIVSSTQSDGFFTWLQLPSLSTTNCKVRISDASDGSPSDESDSFFDISPEPDIEILRPNGNEIFLTGAVEEIRWTSESVENVKIEYTTNNGATWTEIINNLPSNGSYYWSTIPALNSSLCKIKISDADDGNPFDVSNNNFQIANQLGQIITITSPAGGEGWQAGTSQTIQWTSISVNNVKIDYTTNNGQTWIEIVSSTTSDGFYTWAQVPSTASNNCRIRISDAADGVPTVASELFSIEPEPSLNVVSPNGGETVNYGDNIAIKWTSQNVANVKIEYTLNGGANWNTIINSVPSIGTYVWNTALDANLNTNSEQCRIRISDTSDGVPFDISDANFSLSNQVVQSISITSPNGGENWEAGTKHNITWESSAVSKFKIELTTDKGASWATLVDNYAGGAYEWNLAEVLNSTQCQIRISNAENTSVSDISDATFIISPMKWILVTGPQSGIYKSNEPVTITWQSGGMEYVGIKYTTTNGIATAYNPAFTTLVDKVGATSGSYTTYFSLPSDQYFVVVYNADEGANGTPSNNSPGFTVEKAEAASITITAPNGGEEWLFNETFQIKWNGTSINNVKIEWSTTGGGSWNTVKGASSTTNDGSFFWNPADELTDVGGIAPDSSDNCKIRISSTDVGVTASDMTDGYFSIHKSKKIQVTYPNTGEDFYKGSGDPAKDVMAISWSSYGVTSVDIYYSLDNGVTWTTLLTNYQSTGVYGWDYVAETRTSQLGRLRIVDHDDATIWDVNDIPFFLNVQKIGE